MNNEVSLLLSILEKAELDEIDKKIFLDILKKNWTQRYYRYYIRTIIFYRRKRQITIYNQNHRNIWQYELYY